MDLLTHEEIASVTLFTVKASEGELMVWEGCMDYVIKNCSDTQIEQLTGCKDHKELYIFQQEIQKLIKEYANEKYWLDALKDRL